MPMTSAASFGATRHVASFRRRCVAGQGAECGGLERERHCGGRCISGASVLEATTIVASMGATGIAERVCGGHAAKARLCSCYLESSLRARSLVSLPLGIFRVLTGHVGIADRGPHVGSLCLCLIRSSFGARHTPFEEAPAPRKAGGARRMHNISRHPCACSFSCESLATRFSVPPVKIGVIVPTFACSIFERRQAYVDLPPPATCLLRIDLMIIARM